MKDALKKVYPILLPAVCLIAGVLAFIFFFCGPVAKGNYDVLAIGTILIVLSIIVLVVIVVEALKERKKK